MPRDSRVYLEDILTASARIRSYVGDMGVDAFRQDGKTVDAVVRNLDLDIIWDIVANKLPSFTERVRLLLEGSDA